MKTIRIGDFARSSSEYGTHLPGFQGTSIQQFASIFPTEDACLNHLFLFRALAKPRCSRCGAYTSDWQRKDAAKFFYHSCGGIYSPMVGTIFQRSKVSLQQWFYTMLHFANCGRGVNLSFVARQAGVSVPTALRMANQIRHQMAAIDAKITLGARFEPVIAQLHTVRRVTKLKKHSKNRSTILLLSDAERVEAVFLPYPSQTSLRAAIKAKVHPQAIVKSNCHRILSVEANYRAPSGAIEWDLLETGAELQAKQAIHGFLVGFYEALKDQFRSVLYENLWLYLKEFQFRYNRRKRSRMCFWDLICTWPDLNEHSLHSLQSANVFNSTLASTRGY